MGARFPVGVPFCFNSRTREGCDPDKSYHRISRLVSIHAPARGAIHILEVVRCGRRFNSRTREGCDHKRQETQGNSRFQFTHPRGVR